MSYGQFALKKQKQCLTQEPEAGDCWIGLTLASDNGLIVSARVGKYTDALIDQLVVNTEGKTSCKQWDSDDWGGYKRVLSLEVQPLLAKIKHSAQNGQMALFDNRPGDGIDIKTSLVSHGNRRR